MVEWKISVANKAAAAAYDKGRENQAEVRQVKYLNNIVEQDHRGIKRIIRPMKGFKEFHSAKKTLAGIELWRRIKKGQMQNSEDMIACEQFYALAE